MLNSVFSQLKLSGVALLLLCISGCKPANKFVAPPPPKVSVAHPVEQDVVDSIEFTGTTRAVKTVEIRARVNGYLEKIGFRDGADVKEGDLLFTIDQASFKAERDISLANLQRAEAAFELAEANLARTTQLAGQNASSAQQVDLSKAERSTAAANVKAAEAQLKQAELNLSYTEIRSPINGRIGSHLIDVGNLVQLEQSVLAIIESIDPIHVYFYVGERDLLWFMKMLREKKLPDPTKNPPLLEMRLENETEYRHLGHLDYRALGVDPLTGTVLRRGLFPNSDGFLIPGLFVHIRAPIGKGMPKLLVEERALGTDQRGEYLLIVNDKNVVEYRPIKTGIAVGNLRVIEEGIAKDEWVVVNGLQRARPGVTVEPEQTASKPAAADGNGKATAVPAKPATKSVEGETSPAATIDSKTPASETGEKKPPTEKTLPAGTNSAEGSASAATQSESVPAIPAEVSLPAESDTNESKPSVKTQQPSVRAEPAAKAIPASSQPAAPQSKNNG
jgi:RND family efflux transporter MFP subunit